MRISLLLVFGAISIYADDFQLLRDFSVGNIQFTSDVYRELLKSNSGNFLVCPLSVDIILALVYAGAKGSTAMQLSTGLHLPDNPEQVQQIFKQLTPTLQNSGKYNLSSANKVYVSESFKISDQFRNTAVSVYGAEIQNIDFNKNAESANQMNKWVEEKTHDKIRNLVSPYDLDSSTRAVLINAIYFHGEWVKQFDIDGTRKRKFYLNTRDHVETDMMEIVESFNFYDSSDLNAYFLEMPYEGGDITMTIVLPKEKDGLAALEARIEDALVTPNYNLERVHVVIPKFKLETTIQFKPILQELGIRDAFEDNADFSGIGAEGEPLKISKIIQKAFIEVEEKGTTAAAATAEYVVDRIGGGSTVDVQFRADHPFICYIRNLKTGNIMFVGHFVNPDEIHD